MAKDKILLFTYGTLMKGQEPEYMQPITQEFEALGPAWMKGQLVDLGRYPGMVDGVGWVKGQLYAVPVLFLPTLDGYEGATKRGDGLFRRERREAFFGPDEDASGPKGQVTVYIYNKRGGKLIVSGDWTKR